LYETHVQTEALKATEERVKAFGTEYATIKSAMDTA
jgi:hypothetical protein